MYTPLKAIVFITALVPLALGIWDGFHDALGANLVEEITFRSGRWTLRFLLITLAITPLRKCTGWSGVVRLRRMLGLYAFFYACLHFTTWLWLEQFFSWADILEDLGKRRYILVGFGTFLLLLPLALTSTHGMQKRLGGGRWKQLHQLIYLAAGTALLHFFWLTKADYRDPLIYLCVLTSLYILRLPALEPWITRLRSRLKPPTTRG